MIDMDEFVDEVFRDEMKARIMTKEQFKRLLILYLSLNFMKDKLLPFIEEIKKQASLEKEPLKGPFCSVPITKIETEE